MKSELELLGLAPTTDIMLNGKLRPALPDPKSVTSIEGVPLDERLREEEKEKVRLYEVDPEDELKFLEKERPLLEARKDDGDLRNGKEPPQRGVKWASLIFVALSAIVVILKACK